VRKLRIPILCWWIYSLACASVEEFWPWKCRHRRFTATVNSAWQGARSLVLCLALTWKACVLSGRPHRIPRSVPPVRRKPIHSIPVHRMSPAACSGTESSSPECGIGRRGSRFTRCDGLRHRHRGAGMRLAPHPVRSGDQPYANHSPLRHITRCVAINTASLERC